MSNFKQTHSLVAVKMANPNINPNFAVIGTEFVKAFYECYDDPAKRDGLSNFYHNEAFQSFEDDQRMGKAAILEKIKSLPFQSVAHAITKVDSQPTLDGGVLVSILGQVKVDDDKPMGYSHTFILRPESGSFFIMHEIFRLAVHNF